GAGKFASDWNAPAQLHGYFLRSDRAHARIVALDTSHALGFPGVVHIFTGTDALAAGHTRMPHTLRFPGRNPAQTLARPRPALAHGKVRFVGEALALVVAQTAAAAQEAADLIAVDYEELPCVTQPEDALRAGAPQLHDDVPGNLSLE